jgi:glutathione peroxidase
MRIIAWLSLNLLGVLIMIQPAVAATSQSTPLDVDMQSLGGTDVNLAEKYAGKVVLLVNVASKCGLTPQYEALEALHQRYAEQGLAIVGVPCNQFNGQEPGTADEIAEFCRTNYGVEFDMLAKVEVNGEGACTLYKFLTSKEANPEFGGPISWNFEKFLFNRQGQLVARFAPKVKPDSLEVTHAIKTELAAE